MLAVYNMPSWYILTCHGLTAATGEPDEGHMVHIMYVRDGKAVRNRWLSKHFHWLVQIQRCDWL
jgi:hypothetical protein